MLQHLVFFVRYFDYTVACFEIIQNNVNVSSNLESSIHTCGKPSRILDILTSDTPAAVYENVVEIQEVMNGISFIS